MTIISSLDSILLLFWKDFHIVEDWETITCVNNGYQPADSGLSDCIEINSREASNNVKGSSHEITAAI